MKHYSRLGTLVALICTVAVNTAHATQLKVSFDELSQTADLVFIGTVDGQSSRMNDKGSMIFTDVRFRDIKLVHATERSIQKGEPAIRLTYPGGTVGDLNISLSESPSFVTGHRYLVFALDDGQIHSNPMVGASQGLFEVIRDPLTQQEYLLTDGGQAVLGVNLEGAQVSRHRVTSIQGGKLVLDATAMEGPGNAGAPLASDRSTSYRPMLLGDDASAKPMPLSDFLRYVTDVALKATPAQQLIKRDGLGSLYSPDGQKMHAQALPLTPPGQLSSIPLVPPAGIPSAPVEGDVGLLGGATGACGAHDLTIDMEQVPSGWWEFWINNDSMWMWNQFMDVFRYLNDDGSFGHNDVNEFGGYPSSADLISTWGFGWGAGALAMTITSSYPNCGRLLESDVFWNPAYSWTSDANYALGNGSVILLRPVDMHEIGHVWGNQLGVYTETYDYDVATVMQPYYSSVVEDGLGIHVNDAYIIRRHYDDQTGITGYRDVGVESYYASNGLNNSTTNLTTYTPGQSITFNNVLVENNGYNAESDVRIRFYLSTDRYISTSDRQIGGYWYWSSFCGECSSVGTYAATIPSDIAPGTYYVGVIVTVNGFANDNYTSNNATSFYRAINVTCSGTFSFSPSSRSIPNGGNYSSASLSTTGSACPWSASSNASWLAINSGTSGTGNGTIGYSVYANPNYYSRTGVISAGGTTHTVTQPAGCWTTYATPITLGSNVYGSLLSSDCLSPVRLVSGMFRPYADRYSFSGTAGAQVSIALSGPFDTYLYLIGPSGSIVAQDDDSLGNLNSRIPSTGFFTLPSTGTYTIEVTTYSVNVTGSYTLTTAVP